MLAAHTYDVNLLRTFVLIYETRSVTGAARRMTVSQPSVSYALAKLRRFFSDPLFHRGPSGLEPTPLADRLYPDIRQALEALDAVVEGSTGFDPSRPGQTFRLMMTDLGLMALFPYILGSVRRAVPGVRFEVTPLDIARVHQGLLRNEVDAAIGIPALVEGDLQRDHLMDMPYVGVCAEGHPRLSDTPSVTELAGEEFVIVAKTLGHEHVMQRLRDLGLGGAVTVTLPHFAVLAQTLMATEHVSVVPAALADILGAQGGVRQFVLPFDLAPGRVTLYTYRRGTPSPRIEWLRQEIAAALDAYPYPKVLDDPTVR